MLELDATGNVARDLGSDAPRAGGGFLAYPGAQNPNWVTWASWTRPAGHAITADTATWLVPPAPTTYHNQTIYLFNGIEDTATYIFQPVLQYGPVPGYGGGQYWQTACYLVGGIVWGFSGAIQVDTGDVITGVVDSSGIAPGTAYSCKISINGQLQIELDLVNNGYKTWPELWAAVLTLEASGVSACTDYPNVDSTAMTTVSIGTHGGNPSQVAWFPVNQITSCGQHAIPMSYANPGGEVDLFYRSGGGPPATT